MDRWRGKETLLTIAGSVKALSLFRLAVAELVGEKKISYTLLLKWCHLKLLDTVKRNAYNLPLHHSYHFYLVITTHVGIYSDPLLSHTCVNFCTQWQPVIVQKTPGQQNFRDQINRWPCFNNHIRSVLGRD